MRNLFHQRMKFIPLANILCGTVKRFLKNIYFLKKKTKQGDYGHRSPFYLLCYIGFLMKGGSVNCKLSNFLSYPPSFVNSYVRIYINIKVRNSRFSDH